VSSTENENHNGDDLEINRQSKPMGKPVCMVEQATRLFRSATSRPVF